MWVPEPELKPGFLTRPEPELGFFLRIFSGFLTRIRVILLSKMFQIICTENIILTTYLSQLILFIFLFFSQNAQLQPLGIS